MCWKNICKMQKYTLEAIIICLNPTLTPLPWFLLEALVFPGSRKARDHQACAYNVSMHIPWVFIPIVFPKTFLDF